MTKQHQKSPRQKTKEGNATTAASLPHCDEQPATVADTDKSEAPTPVRKKRYNFSKRRAKFTRERDRSSSPTEEHVFRREREPYRPPSPAAAYLRSLRHSKEPPTCLLFGQLREVKNPDHFFCNNCKKYEDCMNSGSIHGNANCASHRFRCTAKHTDYFLPSHMKKVQKVSEIFFLANLHWLHSREVWMLAKIQMILNKQVMMRTHYFKTLELFNWHLMVCNSY
jgi:hypothetical protein